MNILKLYGIQVRRDAHTITPLTVPEHEVAVLQSVFGEENVQNLRGLPIEQSPLDAADVVGEREFNDEFERLASKYGSDEKGELVVETVFGKKAGRGLDRSMGAAAAKEAKFPKAKAGADTPEGTQTKRGTRGKAEADTKDPADVSDPAGSDGN